MSVLIQTYYTSPVLTVILFLLNLTVGHSATSDALDDSYSHARKPYYDVQTTLEYTYSVKNERPREGDGFEYKRSFSPALDQLDLHGVMSSKHARSVFLGHMKAALERNINKITVITGRGKHAEPGKPVGVLAQALPKWINSDSVLHQTVKRCTMKSLGGCYQLTLRSTGDLTWLTAEDHYRKREAARVKSMTHGNRSEMKHHQKHIASYHIRSKPSGIHSETIIHNGQRWLREGGKVALAHCLDFKPAKPMKVTPCKYCEMASKQKSYRHAACPHVLRNSDKNPKLNRNQQGAQQKKSKEKKKTVKNEQPKTIKKDTPITQRPAPLTSQRDVKKMSVNTSLLKSQDARHKGTAAHSTQKVPQYTVIKKEGADHAPTFTVEVVLGGRKALGQGLSIKKAQKQAYLNLKA